jgi:hypothetical protein
VCAALTSASGLLLLSYANIAVCAPSRVSFLNGRRPDSHGVWNFLTVLDPTSVLGLPAAFRQGGWKTFGAGKTDHSKHWCAQPQRFTNRACMKLTVFHCGFGRIGYQRFTKYYHQDAPDSSAIENCLEQASWCVVPRDKMSDYHYTKQACAWLKAAISPRLVPLSKKPPQKKSPLGEKSPLGAPPRVHPNLRRRPGGRTLTASALNETTEALETREPITATALGAMEPFLIMVT